MKKQSKYEDLYSRDLNSIGTEISYSDTSMPPIRSSLKTSLKTSLKRPTHKQHGGNFLDLLFGNSSEIQEGSILTRRILSAIDKSKYEYADALLSESFVADLTVTNNDGQNLLHVLLSKYASLEYAPKVLEVLLEKDVDLNVLNLKDKYGYTPLYYAINSEIDLDDIADRLIELGADKRVGNKYVVEDNQNQIINIISVPKQSIFSGRTPSGNNDIEIIAKSFLTDRQDDETELLRSASEFEPKQIPIYSADLESANPGLDNSEVIDQMKELLEKIKRKPTVPSQSLKPLANIQEVPSMRRIFIASPEQKKEKLEEPVDPMVVDSEDFVNALAAKMVQDQTGGARKGTKKKSKDRISGTRAMIGFSEVDGGMNFHSDMIGGLSDDALRSISRAATNQKNQFHEEAVEKVLSLLDKKDKLVAKAIKAIIYNEIKQNKPQLSGLDRAAEMLKAITKDKINSVLEQKDLIDKIIGYLTEKNDKREKDTSKSSEVVSSESEEKPKKKAKATKKVKGESGIKSHMHGNFESSVETSSNMLSEQTSSDSSF